MFKCRVQCSAQVICKYCLQFSAHCSSHALWRAFVISSLCVAGVQRQIGRGSAAIKWPDSRHEPLCLVKYRGIYQNTAEYRLPLRIQWNMTKYKVFIRTNRIRKITAQPPAPKDTEFFYIYSTWVLFNTTRTGCWNTVSLWRKMVTCLKTTSIPLLHT